MSRVSINDQYLTDIGDGIREKLGVQTLYKPSQMKSAILSIPGASTLVSKTIIQNGTYDPAEDNADGYSSVVVNVPQGGDDSFQLDPFTENIFLKNESSMTVTADGTNKGVTFAYSSGSSIQGQLAIALIVPSTYNTLKFTYVSDGTGYSSTGSDYRLFVGIISRTTAIQKQFYKSLYFTYNNSGEYLLKESLPLVNNGEYTINLSGINEPFIVVFLSRGRNAVISNISIT